MIPPALGRLVGPALLEPARLVFPVLLAVLLTTFLTACRDQSNAYFIQGAALGTGYHVTLYADPNVTEISTLEAGIQGDLAVLERIRNELKLLDATAFSLFGLALPQPSRQGVDRWLQVTAVDHLTQRLATHDAIEAVLVEVGGVLRGHGAPPGGGWHLSLGQVGVSTPEGSREIHLHNAALVHRFADISAAPLVRLAPPFAVSVIAEDARTAHNIAELLVAAGPDKALDISNEMDSAARVVVKTVTGIEIHYSRAIEHWLESSL